MSVETGSRYLESLLKGREALHYARGQRLRELRMQAVERANALTVPTQRDEEWRFTDLSPLYRMAFRPASRPGTPSPALLNKHAIMEAKTCLVFLDGHYAAGLSRVDVEDGVTVGNLIQPGAMESDSAVEHLGKLAAFEHDAFTAVNTAHLADVAVIRVARGHKAADPIHVLFVATQAESACYPRVLVVAEAGAECMVVEDYAGAEDGAYLTDAVTEIQVGANARVSHVRLQRESQGAFHIANTSVRVEHSGRYANWSIGLGARISRHNLNVMQAGEGTEFSIDGLALIGGRQLADTHSSIDHAYARGVSRQLHKTVVAGGAHAVFNGKILVRPGAQQTDSGQQARNLLLSDKARVDAKPQLEIFADDVKCAHGATVGQLEADELFYLKSRGLSDSVARSLLTYAFAAEIIERIPLKSLAGKLEQQVLEQTRGRQA